MKRIPISVSERCSRTPTLISRCLKKAAASLVLAAALLLSTSGCLFAAVRVEGVPPWLAPAATRSMEAVWKEIDPRQDETARVAVVKLVAGRLFEGYDVLSARIEGMNLTLVLKAASPIDWEVEAALPVLPEPLSLWLASDWTLARNQVSALVSGLPLNALNWADSSLRQEVSTILAASLPGWQGSLVVRDEGSRAVLRIGLVPSQPLILAVNPRTTSTSLPTLLHSDLKESLLTGLSPLVGLPVAWVALHERQVGEWAAGLLENKTLVENLKVQTTVRVKPQPVTDLSVRLESRRYTIWVWAAGYAGTDDRFPEAGLHLGRKAQIFPGWDVELYGEALLFLNDWDFETRLGLRWSPWDRIWVGTEHSWPDESTWWRVWFDGPVGSPYAWARGSEAGDMNFGIGYRLNENLSIEYHYDDRDKDASSVRLVGNL